MPDAALWHYLLHSASLGEISPPGGQQVPGCLKIRQVGVKTQMETLAGHLQSPYEQGFWKNPRGTLNLREKGTSPVSECP